MRMTFTSCVTALLAMCSGCSTLVTVREDYQVTRPWQGYERLVLRTENGRIELSTNTANTDVTITGTKQAGGVTTRDAEENLSRVDVRAAPDETDPKTLIVELDYPEDLRWKNIGASLRVSVPQPVSTDALTRNGSIDIRNTKSAKLRSSNGTTIARDVDGWLDAQTSNGRIEAERIAGDAELQTSNGSVVVRGVGGRTRVNTSNGGIEVRDATGDVDCATSNGSIVVNAQPPVEGIVSLVTSNGGIRATLPQTLKGSVDVSTSNGSLTTNLGNATISQAQWSKRRLAAQLNGGGTGRIHARTSNGSLVLDCR